MIDGGGWSLVSVAVRSTATHPATLPHFFRFFYGLGFPSQRREQILRSSTKKAVETKMDSHGLDETGGRAVSDQPWIWPVAPWACCAAGWTGAAFPGLNLLRRIFQLFGGFSGMKLPKNFLKLALRAFRFTSVNS